MGSQRWGHTGPIENNDVNQAIGRKQALEAKRRNNQDTNAEYIEKQEKRNKN